MFLKARYFTARFFASLFLGASAAPHVPHGPVATPTDRIVVVDSELRTALVAAELRSVSVDAETRIVVTDGEAREITP